MLGKPCVYQVSIWYLCIVSFKKKSQVLTDATSGPRSKYCIEIHHSNMCVLGGFHTEEPIKMMLNRWKKIYIGVKFLKCYGSFFVLAN